MGDGFLERVRQVSPPPPKAKLNKIAARKIARTVFLIFSVESVN
jgi:hypothetical protein